MLVETVNKIFKVFLFNENSKKHQPVGQQMLYQTMIILSNKIYLYGQFQIVKRKQRKKKVFIPSDSARKDLPYLVILTKSKITIV